MSRFEVSTQTGVDSGEGRSVIARAFSVLAAFGDQRSSVSLGDLAERTGLPKGSLHRLCAQLVAQGAVERTEHGYRLGLRMFELGSQVPALRRLRDLAVPYMAELHTTTKCSVHLTVLAGTDSIVLNAVAGQASVRHWTPVGGRRSLVSTASGKTLLAFAPEELRGRLMPVTHDALRRELELIAAGGCGQSWVPPHLQALALPLLDRRQRAVAALSLCGASLGPRQAQLVKALRETAAALDHRIRDIPGLGVQYDTAELADIVGVPPVGTPRGPSWRPGAVNGDGRVNWTKRAAGGTAR